MSRPCPECEAPVEVDPVTVLGRTITPAVLCPECSARLEEERALAAETPEDRIYRKLHDLGINVPARGRFSFAEACKMVGGAGAEAAQRFVRKIREAGRWDPVRGLIFEGPTGVGKSLLVCGIVRELLETRTLTTSQLVYDSSRGIWGMIRSAYGGGDAQGIIRARIQARLWVLDDLGAEHASEDAGFNLTEILTGRELRPTLITANVPRDDQGERWNPAVWDRIKSRLGDRNFEVVTVLGRDHRTAA